MIRIPSHYLPKCDPERARFFRHWWPDKNAKVLGVDEQDVLIHLTWPRTQDLAKDPRILDGVATVFPGAHTETVAQLRGEIDGVHVCLNDSWTLLRWSEVVAADPKIRPIIVHVDAHSDLMTPMISLTDGQLLDIFTGKHIRIDQPSTVLSSIESGSIGIGSFISPFLHQVECEALIHICPRVYRSDIRGWAYLHCIKMYGEPFPEIARPGIERVDEHIPDSCPHLVAETLDGIEIDLAQKDVFLHIDLDFFNNRINGDSHWFENESRHDPNIETMLAAVDSLADQLHNCGLDRLSCVVVACSPEFCPAEHWRPLIDRIVRHFGH